MEQVRQSPAFISDLYACTDTKHHFATLGPFLSSQNIIHQIKYDEGIDNDCIF
jgi:hypothetical protein